MSRCVSQIVGTRVLVWVLGFLVLILPKIHGKMIFNNKYLIKTSLVSGFLDLGGCRVGTESLGSRLIIFVSLCVFLIPWSRGNIIVMAHGRQSWDTHDPKGPFGLIFGFGSGTLLSLLLLLLLGFVADDPRGSFGLVWLV